MNSNEFRSALNSRLLRRAVASGEICLPAVPAMLADYEELCLRTFAALGVTFNAEETARLREILAGQLEAAYAASPRSEIVISYEAPVGQTVNYNVKAQWSSLEATYDAWVATREPPYFGTAPDARVWALARQAGDPADCAVLDLGAGTGRNALALARRGHPVDAVEMTTNFAAMLRRDAAAEGLAVRVFERNLFDHDDDLRRDYGLMVLSEVASDFRNAGQLRRLFELAAACLAPGGCLVFNVFLPQVGYTPDAAALQLGQQMFTTVFTYPEMSAAASGLPLAIISDESVYDYEHQYLPEEAWPPTSWYANWVSGLDLFDLKREQSPVEMRWLVYRKEK